MKALSILCVIWIVVTTMIMFFVPPYSTKGLLPPKYTSAVWSPEPPFSYCIFLVREDYRIDFDRLAALWILFNIVPLTLWIWARKRVQELQIQRLRSEGKNWKWIGEGPHPL